jgi:flagellar protein FlgJ
MAMTGIEGLSSGIDSRVTAARSAQFAEGAGDFAAMLERAAKEQNGAGIESEDASRLGLPKPHVTITARTRLNGDYTSGFQGAFTSPLDKAARPTGMAHGQNATIDKTSELYESALEFESYFVKIMLSSMRNSVTKSSITGEESFASQMYEDMLYDELAVTMTKNAGFGLADQIYLALNTDTLE